MDQQDAVAKFKIWFGEPIDKLKDLPQGNGGIAAFIIGISLYERLIKAKLAITNQPENIITMKETIKNDLMLNNDERKIFWDMFRNGLTHQGLPKAGRTGYWFDDSFSAYPKFEHLNNQTVICINPWKFTDRILTEFLTHPELITASTNYPFPIIL